MEWHDHGIVLAQRRHGERAFLVDVLTQGHGVHGGLIREAKTLGGALEPGSDLSVTWRARLADHLGTWRIETARVRAAQCLDDPARLAALTSATAVTLALLPEREPHPAIHAALTVLLDAVEADAHWAALYVRYELGLLSDLGFGLDLSQCALTGAVDDLAWVSPRTGRAVSRAAGAPWALKLLPVPGFLRGEVGHGVNPVDLSQGLALTGHFLARHAPARAWERVVEVRGRLTQRLQPL